ncbi:ABC transporter permease subunit [Sporosarcina sp. A2]|uniref:ABC transporter permease subunit n=1 Tax=Sporosarcina sp. A2 TaxID=3393449 RepID=UPI003D795C26
MKTFLFECKKLFRKRKVWTAAILTSAAIIVLYLFSYHTAESIRSVNILKAEQYKNVFTSMSEEARTEIARSERTGDDSTVKELKEAIVRAEKSQENYEQLISDFQNRSWKRIYQQDLDFLEIAINEKGSTIIEEQPINDFTLRATKIEKEWLLKRNLDPLIQQTVYTAYLPTIYDTFTGKAEEEWKKITTRYAETGVGFTYTMMSKYYLPLLALISCFVFGNGFSSQMNRKERGLHFAMTQPVRKITLFTANYGSAIISVVGFFIFLTGLPFLCSLLTKGIGSFQFPVLVYEGGKENPFGSEFNALNPETDLFHFIPFQTYFLKAIVLGILLTLVLLGLYTLYSLLIKSAIGTVVMTGGTAAVGWILLKTSPYNPFTYLDIHGVLNGTLAAEAFNPAFSFETGVGVLAIAAIVFLTINFLVFQWFSRRVA